MYFLGRRIHHINFYLKQLSSAFLLWLVFYQKKQQNDPTKGIINRSSDMTESVWPVAHEPRGSHG